jgi:hypothetical protein
MSNIACRPQIGGPQPPNLWSRATGDCLNGYNPEDLAMRRKAEVLKYKGNQNHLTKRQQWARNINGYGPLGKKVWASQTDLGSNPNIFGLEENGNTLILCPSPTPIPYIPFIFQLNESNYGSGVSLSGDGMTLVVGGTADRSVQKVYVYTKNNNIWNETTPTIYSATDYGITDGSFGSNALISNDNSTLVINANESVFIFKKTGLIWNTTASTIITQNISGFGRYVSINSDGTRMVIASPIENGGDGAVYVYTIIANVETQTQYITYLNQIHNWGLNIKMSNDGTSFVFVDKYKFIYLYRNIQTFIPVQTFSTSDPDFDFFGTSLSLSNDGNILIVGASNYQSNPNINSIYIYTTSDNWSTINYTTEKISGSINSGFGQCVTINSIGTLIAVSAINENKLYLYEFNNNSWNNLKNTIQYNLNNGFFGNQLSLINNGSEIAIGDPTNEIGKSGKVYIYDTSTPSTIPPSTNVICAPSTASDVPGPEIQLCYNPSIPLIGYGNPRRTYLAGNTKFPQMKFTRN